MSKSMIKGFLSLLQLYFLFLNETELDIFSLYQLVEICGVGLSHPLLFHKEAIGIIGNRVYPKDFAIPNRRENLLSTSI